MSILKYKHCWMSDASMVAGVRTGAGFSNTKNFRTWTRTRMKKFWNRSGVGVWKCDFGHLCWKQREAFARWLLHRQGYHRSRTKNKQDWGKFDFPTQNKSTFGEIVSVCAINVRYYICSFISRRNLFQQFLILRKKNSCISNSFLQSSGKTFFFCLLISWFN